MIPSSSSPPPSTSSSLSSSSSSSSSRLSMMTSAEIAKAKEDTVRLAKLYEIYSRPRNFKPGDFVQFHPSMRHRPNPSENTLGIVTRVLSCPFYEDFNATTYAPDPIDIVIGSLTNRVEDTSPYDDIGNVGTVCSNCGIEGFRGLKHRCLICENCILCDACHRAHHYPPDHTEGHPTEASGPPTTATLRKMYSALVEDDEPLKPGDIVMWKEGLKNKNLPMAEMPCVVIEVMPNVVYDYTEDGSESSYFREPYNVRLGVFNHKETSLCIYYYDSRRFKRIKSANQ